MLEHHDQADGLRKMMRKQPLRTICVFNTSEDDSNHWLFKLAASLNTRAERLLLIKASAHFIAENNHTIALETTSNQQTRKFKQAISVHPLGFDQIDFFKNSPLSPALSADSKFPLERIVKQVANNYDTVMIEVKHSNEEDFTLPKIAQQEVIIQMQRNEAGIKSAYACIKRIYQRQHYQQPMSLLVTSANHVQGQQFYLRLNQVCQHFLGINLNYFGAIPAMSTMRVTSEPNRRMKPLQNLEMADSTPLHAGDFEKHVLLSSSPLIAA